MGGQVGLDHRHLGATQGPVYPIETLTAAYMTMKPGRDAGKPLLRCKKGTEGRPWDSTQGRESLEHPCGQPGRETPDKRPEEPGNQRPCCSRAAEKQEKGQGHLLALQQQQKGCWPERPGEGWECQLMF